MATFRLSALSVAAILGFVVAPVLVPQVARGVAADAADDQYAVASGHFRARRWELAAEEYERFLELWPKHRQAASAKFFLGEARMELRLYERARLVLRELAGDRSFPHRPRVLFRIGQASWRLGDDKAARRELAAFLEEYPKDVLRELALPYLADSHLALGEFQQARTRYEQALDEFPEGRLADDCRYGLARALEQLDEVPRAIDLYRALADSSTTDLADDAQLNLGARLFDRKQFEEAARVLEQLPRKFPESTLIPAARLNEGWARFQLGQYAGAAAIFARLTEHAEFGLEAQYWYGLSYKALRRWNDAIRILLACAAHEEHRLAAEAEFQAADALVQDGQNENAIEHFVHVASRWPKAAVADDSLFYASQTYLQLEQYDRVRAVAAELTRRYPESPLALRAQVLAGQAHMAEKQYREAVAVLEPVIEKAGDDPTARIQLGIAYQQLDRHDDALKVLAPLHDGEPKDPRVAEVSYRMATSYAALGRHGEAAPLLEEYLRADGDGPFAERAQARLAICYANLDRLDEARDRWRRLVESDGTGPVTVPATYQVAEIAYGRGKIELAEEMFAWIVRNDGSGDYTARSLSGLGWCQFDRKQFDAAAQTMQRLLNEHPNDMLASEAALLRARALESAGNDAESLSAYAVVIERYAQSREAPIAALQRARLLYRIKDFRQAAEAYDRVFSEYSDLDEPDQAAYERAWVHVDLGEGERANELFLDLAKQFPNSPLAPDALLNVAEANYRAGDYAESLDLLEKVAAALGNVADAAARARLQEALLYRRGRIAADQEQWEAVRDPLGSLVKEYPDSVLVPEAEFWLAEADYRLGENGPAEERLRGLLNSAEIEQTAWVGTAWLRLAQVLARRKAWQEALESLEALKKRFPKYELTYEADYLMGRCLSSLPSPRFDQAREAFQRCIASPQGNKTETAAQAQWMIGETYFHQRDYKRALREFLRIEPLYDYPLWQAAGLLEAGKCSEELAKAAGSAGDRQRYWQQSADLYRRILEHPEYSKTEFAEQANKRLAAVQERLRIRR